MKYESRPPWSNAPLQASYHCGYGGCSVRYNPAKGYHTVIGVFENAHALEEPGVNTMKCPIHGTWLYRREDQDSESGVRWACGVEGCNHSYTTSTKGSWVRT